MEANPATAEMPGTAGMEEMAGRFRHRHPEEAVELLEALPNTDGIASTNRAEPASSYPSATRAEAAEATAPDSSVAASTVGTNANSLRELPRLSARSTTKARYSMRQSVLQEAEAVEKALSSMDGNNPMAEDEMPRHPARSAMKSPSCNLLAAGSVTDGNWPTRALAIARLPRFDLSGMALLG